MIGKVAIALLSAGLLAACQPSAPDEPKAPDAVSPARTAVIASGAPVLNAEYGVSAVFPTGSRVCEALSGEHPHGFYTRLGDPEMDCVPSRDPPKVSSMLIWADYNAASQSVEEMGDPTCPNRNVRAPDGTPLGFPGHDSMACETRLANGDVQVSVRTHLGTQVDNFTGPNSDETRTTPRFVYTAWLHTTTRTEAADKAVFRQLLNTVALSVLETPSDGDAPHLRGS